MRSNRPFRVALTGLLVLAALVLASCAPTLMRMETGPRAWVGGPPDGSEVPLGVVSVMCHGYAGAGVTHLELWLNGAFANRAANASPGSEYFTASMTFETMGPGRYVVHCRTYDQDGGTAQSEPVTLRVPGEEPTATTGEEEIPTATPTSTEVPPTVTVPPPTGTTVPPTSTSIPPTSTRIPPTSTPSPSPTREPPRITSFEVSDSQITLGQCVTFSYVVAGSPDAIFFDGGGVGGPSGSVDRCPTATREFVLTAEVGGQVVDSASLTVVVIQPSPSPSDRDGPQIYREIGPSVMAAPYKNSCTSPYQFGAIVRDASGVRWVKLICSFNQGPEQSCGGLQLTGSDYYEIDYSLPTDGSIQPGFTMHWHIRACDVVDPMNCTDSPSYTVSIGNCIT